jgi:hypothetical protein
VAERKILQVRYLTKKTCGSAAKTHVDIIKDTSFAEIKKKVIILLLE